MSNSAEIGAQQYREAVLNLNQWVRKVEACYSITRQLPHSQETMRKSPLEQVA